MEPGRRETEPAPEHRGMHAAYAVLALAAATLPWVPRWDATQDGPQHIRLSAFVLEMRGDPTSPLHAAYHDSLGLVTGSLFTWFSYLLHGGLSLSVDTAGRLWLSLCIAGSAWVGWLITRTAHPGAPARALLLAPFFLHGLTTYGFFPYLGSIPLAAASVWLLMAPPRSSSRFEGWAPVLACGLLFLTALSHVSSLVIAFGTVLAMLVWRRPNVRAWASTLLAFAPAAWVSIHSTRMLDVALSTHQSPPNEGIETMNPVETAVRALMYAQAGVSWIDRVAQIAMLALLIALVVRAVAFHVRRSGGAEAPFLELRAPSPYWPFALLALFGVALFTLPARLSGFTHANGRVVPFILFILPSVAWWPRVGSRVEARLVRATIALSVVAFVGIGYGWWQIGQHLDSVAGAADVLRPGSRVLPLVFEPGPDAAGPVRSRGSGSLHSWAVAARLQHAMVPFGFENMRRLMLIARADARPPFPPGPDEFAARVLWGPEPRLPRVFADYGPSLSEITDDARFVDPSLDRPGYFDAVREAVLTEAQAGFHYLLAIDPPPSFLGAVKVRGWPSLYERDGVYVFRLGLPLAAMTLPYADPRDKKQR